MRLSWGFLSLGMMDVRASPPPVPEDARRWAINRAHAEAQKKWKDAKAVKRTKKILAHEELDKRRRQQRKDGLLLEESPSSSVSMDASDGDDGGEMGRGPLDHLPDVGETVPGASANSPALPEGGGGAVPRYAVARPGVEADTLEAWALGKHAVSPMGPTVVAEQAAVGATPPPLQRIKGAPGPVGDRSALVDAEAAPLPRPPPLQTRVAVPKRLQPHSGRKRSAEVLSLAPLKALKVSPGSSAHWVAEVQAALQHGAASARADPKEPVTQGGVAEATPTQTGEGVLSPREGEAHESDGAEVPLVAEATEVEVPRVPEAKAMEAGALKTAEATAAGVDVSATTEATMAEAGAPETAKAMIAEAGPLEITEADVTVARPSAQEVEMKAAEALVAPLVQGPPVGGGVHPAAEASIVVQAVLETEIGEHETLKSAAHTACEASEIEGVQSGSSLGSRLIALSGQMREQLRGALHTGVKRALAVIASHYISVDLSAISDGYVLPDDDEEADVAISFAKNLLGA
ncbi:uncharacterized protein [Miscanthus floridulus]|uniref:uncharacterized protein n=1 Tax=Miscanthus floridulus TaxID=154761 RepID=UPI00345752A6